VIVSPPKVPERDPEEASRWDRPPRPNRVEVEARWKTEPGQPRYQPCSFLSYGGGPHGAEHLPDVWIRCDYRCGRYRVILYDVRGKSGTECEKPRHIERADELAKNRDKQLRAKGG
jgi:hypothetical protein